jgi:hypothetical protein
MNPLNLLQADSELSVWLVLDGKEYEASQFSVSFNQAIDRKGQPQDEIRGGRMLVTLTQALPESVYRWAVKTEPKNGELVFRSPSANSPFRIEFINAYCVNFKRDIVRGGGGGTTLFISPDEIYVNGISFDNHWIV